MIPAAFEYARPDTVAEAVDSLASAGDEGKALAGGQSLIPMMRLRLTAPELLVDLGRVEEMRGIRDDGESLLIGAMTTHDAILRDPLIREHAPLIRQATATVADRQVRHLGTFGGSLAHADPAGDLPSVALAMEASFEIAGAAGRRSVPAEAFFVDYMTSAIEPDELLVSVRVPKLTGWRTHYEKFHQMAQAWATVGVAAAIQQDGGTITGARVALTNMAPTPLRARAVEAALIGSTATPDLITEAAATAAEGSRPTSDLVASSAYRTHLAPVLTRRAVRTASGI